MLVIARRGGCGLAPENTMVAFRQAMALGVDVLELGIDSSKFRKGMVACGLARNLSGPRTDATWRST